MSDEHSFSLQPASTELSRTGGQAPQAGAGLPLSWTAAKPIAAGGIVRWQSRPFRLRGGAKRRSVIGETPQWALWTLVGLLLFMMLLPALKR
jgi:hypothetical protein